MKQNKFFYLNENKLVLLKREMGQIFQYSFLAKVWYNVPELKGVEDYPELLTVITEEEANEYISAVETMIETLKHQKSK